MTVYVVIDCNDIVVGIFDSMKLAEKAKKEFDESFDGDCPYCDEWDSHIEEFKLNFMYDIN